MDTNEQGAFGPNFMPGQVKADQSAAAQALGMRWSGMPAHTNDFSGMTSPMASDAMGSDTTSGEMAS